jgi:hypothetical protein
MARNQYLVVLHEGEWKIKHGEEYSARYRTQTDHSGCLCHCAQG